MTGDRRAVTAVLDSIVAAWNAGDANAFGASFAEDATYVTFTGVTYRGREAIVRAHEELFRTHLSGVTLTQRILDLRWVAPDVAVVITRGGTRKGAPPVRTAKTQTHVLACRDGRWEVVAFHNTQRHRLLGWLTARNPATAGNLGPQAG